MARSGAVWYGDRKVGSLRTGDRGSLRFAYDLDWLASDAFAVSISLPLEQGDAEVPAHGYFEGLLPEGRARQRICRQKGIGEDDDAGLLFAIGGDCAGALSILPDGQTPDDIAGDVVDLDEATITELIRTAGTSPAMVTGSPRRFSLAGAQEKLPVIVTDTGLALSDTKNPSSHILKFETERWICFAEAITNRLGAAAGLPVVETGFHPPEGGDGTHPYLLVSRYDRAQGKTGLVRLHQEDMAQAMGLSSSLKYQRDAGPSIADIVELVRAHGARPAEMIGLIRDWQIFNVLVGNWDGHAKNLSLLHLPGEGAPSLAPFYDLVSIELLNLIRPGAFARDLAFSVGGAFVPERIGRAEWTAFAKACELPTKALLRRVAELADALPPLASEVIARFEAEHGAIPIREQWIDTVTRRCRWTAQSLV